MNRIQAYRPPEEPRRPSGPPEIGPTEVEKGAVLGDGSFGTVFKGKCREKDVAVKFLHKQDLDAKTLEAFRKEVEIMSKIFHPNIVLFMGACTVPGSMMIVTELMNRDLEGLLQDQTVQLSLITRMRMAKDAALGMTWLHYSNPAIIHRDLKTSNLLIDDNFQIKLCDFGLSQIKSTEFLKDGADGAKGTPLWMAPEVLSGKPFNEKADVYSFGIVLWEILTRQEPFAEFDNFEEFRTAVCLHHRRPLIPPDTLPSIRILIESCWQPDPSRRPKFTDIVNALYTIIIECSIRDPDGVSMWKKYFLKKETVPWSEFIQIFIQMIQQKKDEGETNQLLPVIPTLAQLRSASDTQLQEFASRSPENAHYVQQEYMRRQTAPMDIEIEESDDDLNIKCLKAILAEKPKPTEGVILEQADEVVHIEKLGKILDWFGPICDPTTRSITMLDKITSLLRKNWFFGDLGTKEAESKLTSEPFGTFLVRFSSSHAGCYTISKVAKQSITHQRIIHTPGHGFYINSKRYHSLEEMIMMAEKELNATRPCPGHPFSNLFINFRVGGYIQGSTTYSG